MTLHLLVKFALFSPKGLGEEEEEEVTQLCSFLSSQALWWNLCISVPRSPFFSWVPRSSSGVLGSLWFSGSLHFSEPYVPSLLLPWSPGRVPLLRTESPFPVCLCHCTESWLDSDPLEGRKGLREVSWCSSSRHPGPVGPHVSSYRVSGLCHMRTARNLIYV